MLTGPERNVSSGDTQEEDLFDVALEDADKPAKTRSAPGRRGAPQPNAKRQHKNEKYGFGGKKRFSKSGDAVSSADLSGFSVKKMKTGGGKTKRPGKSRRAKLT
jgi:rRNA-processing protein EBP2